MRLLYFIIVVAILLIWSCHSEIPFDPGPMNPDLMDTTSAMNPGDTTVNPGDTITNPGDTVTIDTMMQPCDTNVVYFDSQILPILQGNCAFAGCHDPVTAEHGLVLNSYENLMNHDDLVKPFDLDESELYEKITEDDQEDRMPPAPNSALTQEQILLIGKWILQGAENTSCDRADTGCDTTMVSFSADVQPIFNTYCITCHGSTNPNAGVSLSTYNGILPVANSGKLLGVVSWANGFLKMPLGGNQIPACDINTIEAWINQGLLNN